MLQKPSHIVSFLFQKKVSTAFHANKGLGVGEGDQVKRDANLLEQILSHLK
jgi:hypothetical protein